MRTHVEQYVWCDLCGATCVMQPMRCNQRGAAHVVRSTMYSLRCASILLCGLACATYALQPIWGNICRASYGVQSVWCNQRGTIYMVQAM
eukprot:5126501-Pyramimonas_sp.AAC.1